MKTFGKVLLGLGTFAAGMYAGAFISAYVAEKVMDSPLDESVLRKHVNHKNKSKLGYSVFADSDGLRQPLYSAKHVSNTVNGEEAPAYYTSFDAFLHEDRDSFPPNSKVRIKMKDGAVIDYVKNPDGWVMDATVPDPIHVSAIIYGDINRIKLEYYEFFDNDLILNFPNDDSDDCKIYKYADGKLIDIDAYLCYDEDTGMYSYSSDDSDDDNGPVIADYKGSVKTFADLPKDADIGDYFFVEDADNGKGCIYIYTKNGYAIPEIADDVSLNDIFTFKKDALQNDIDSTDTDSDTVPTYYESLKLFLGDERTVSMPWGTKVRIKMKDGVVLQYERNDFDGWVLDSAVPDPNHISGIFYGSINLVNFDHYNFHEGDLILNIPFAEDASEKAKLYKWHDGEITDTGIMIDRRDEDDTAAEESNS